MGLVTSIKCTQSGLSTEMTQIPELYKIYSCCINSLITALKYLTEQSKVWNKLLFGF